MAHHHPLVHVTWTWEQTTPVLGDEWACGLRVRKTFLRVSPVASSRITEISNISLTARIKEPNEYLRVKILTKPGHHSMDKKTYGSENHSLLQKIQRVSRERLSREKREQKQTNKQNNKKSHSQKTCVTHPYAFYSLL